MTGYFGLMDVGMPQPGETVVISGAAGAVGQTVGQIAKIKGCRVVGIAGGPAKCEWVVKELGFDACIDYKAGPGAVRAGLKEHCPKGVDIYFDNVGGAILDAALSRLALRARVVLCGSVSQYAATGMVGITNYRSLLVKRGRMEGFILYDFAARYEEARADLGRWLADGSLIMLEDFMDGIASFPQAMRRMLTGDKTGKLLIRVGAQ